MPRTVCYSWGGASFPSTGPGCYTAFVFTVREGWCRGLQSDKKEAKDTSPRGGAKAGDKDFLIVQVLLHFLPHVKYGAVAAGEGERDFQFSREHEKE